jgi:hypothetical protein
MNKIKLKELIQEILSELSPETLSAYKSKAQRSRANAQDTAFGVGKDVGSDTDRAAAYRQIGKRTRGIQTATDKIDGAAKKPGQTWTTPSGKKATKNSDGSITYRDPNAKSVVGRIKSFVGMKEDLNGGVNESKGIIRLKELLNESMIERRVNLVRVQTVLEKLYPELNETQTKKIMELCTEAHMVASQLNTTRYVRTESSLLEWKLLAIALESKLNELKEEVVKACETKKIDSTTAVKALETVLEY